MAEQPHTETTHDDFAAHWSPARQARDMPDRQQTKVAGWEPVSRDE